ncbi:deaminase domain-containing protein [Pseudomonas sp. R1-7]|uniref:deaminase domain-containing protein n=1 Tax=Pseudomonas sp. R1-7 TaxID=2817398 RepID=UPI003DA9CAA8
MSSLLTPDPLTAASLSPAPSPDEQHQGLLGDYDSLLLLIRNTAPEELANTLVKPKRCSPMYMEDEAGQRPLQALVQHQDYRDLCRSLGASHHPLTVTWKDGRAIYETLHTHSEVAIQIPLGSNPVWDGWLPDIEKAARKLGGQIRQHGEVTFARMAWFYGIKLPDPLDDKECEAAVQVLEEKRARHSLGLGYAIRVDELGHGADAGSRSVEDLIMETMRERLPQLRTSLLTHLSPIDIGSLTTRDLRAKPSFYLEKILASEEAQALTDALLRALKWYGGNHGEDSAPSIRIKLLVKAIDLWLRAGKNQQEGAIAGYQWQAPSNWGKSYEAIWLAFESHLLASKLACSVNESILLACLYRSSFPLDFQIPDIPSGLPYRSSIVWVNFIHGVQLANAVDPTLLQRLSGQQLMDLPAKYIDEGTAEDLNLVSLTRVQPALAWAVTNGFVPERTDANYSVQAIERAMQKLDEAMTELSSTIIDLDKKPPERLKIATRELTRLFPRTDFLTQEWKLERETSLSRTVPQTAISLPQVHSHYSLVDVYASGELSKAKWYITQPNTLAWLTLSEEGTLDTNLLKRGSTKRKRITLPNIEDTFDVQFKAYIKLIRSAYRTLIIHQLASLPLIDRRALEYGTIKLYSLRKATGNIGGMIGVEEETSPLRTRGGFILEAIHDGKARYYELLPRAGVIRPRLDIAPNQVGVIPTLGLQTNPAEQLHLGVPVSFQDKNITLPFDWNAHTNGTVPEENMQCQAIIAQIGGTLGRLINSDLPHIVPATLESESIQSIANHIAERFLFIDETALRRTCYGHTEFDRQKANFDTVTSSIKSFIPFWDSVENLSSGKRKKVNEGLLGLAIDLATFALPLGKFASGSMKIIRAEGKLSFTKKLPLLAKKTGALLNATLNPIDGIPSLLKAGGLSLFRLSKKGYLSLKTLSGRAGRYDFLQGVPQTTEPGHWRALSAEDQLAIVYGTDDVPVRKIFSGGKAEYRLIDPQSSKPYGPALSEESSGLALGRSHYATTYLTDTHVVVELPRHTRVREVMGLDANRTFYLDDVPYRLDGNTLRRGYHASRLKKISCRGRRRRALDEVCHLGYSVLDGYDQIQRPPNGTFSTEKAWAPWFCDTVVYPSAAQDSALSAHRGEIYIMKGGKSVLFEGTLQDIGLQPGSPIPKKEITANIECQTGIFAGILVTGSASNIDDFHQTGAIILDSLKEDARYVFTALNDEQYYLAKIPPSGALPPALTLNKLEPAELSDGTLGAELKRVYLGSYEANYMARIHGTGEMQDVLEQLKETAALMGAPAIPPTNMKWVKVDTSPAEALLFDRETRALVTQYKGGDVQTWKAIGKSSRETKNKINETLNVIFGSPTNLNEAIKKVRKETRSFRDKNIAFAELITTSKQTEVYVSVSGTSNFTERLPLFKDTYGANINKDGIVYINVDNYIQVPATSISQGASGNLLSIPRTGDAAAHITSADSESKLIRYITERHPNRDKIESITLVTALPPCESCSVIVKQYAFEHDIAKKLEVIWGKRSTQPGVKINT